eukprot:CAMPEP_0173241218 /NCGR_PEP_ID=MMETSP1142-20121109/14257_1 /TAXON_ID=483371 /ORGANISM="non described non described, Strain CCMP2298" /LENGTH=44 /DNA_ID= /DNA_START= /DNA_END= /DNA_ORIENTATION=
MGVDEGGGGGAPQACDSSAHWVGPCDWVRLKALVGEFIMAWMGE